MGRILMAMSVSLDGYMEGSSPGDLPLGGARLAAAFRRHGLIDEYRIYVHPVAIGMGTPLFDPAGGTLPLDLVGTRTFGNGVVQLRYVPRCPSYPPAGWARMDP
jgi:hypothetical protein